MIADIFQTHLGTFVPFPVTSKSIRYIFVATDVFTKYVEIWAVPSQTAVVCASIILNDAIDHWARRF